MKITTPDDPKVDTDSVTAIFKDHQTKVLEKEPEQMKDAVLGLQKLMGIQTPKYKEGKERKVNDLGIEIEAGEEEKYLYQFRIENKEEFDQHAVMISRGMSVIPTVIVSYWKQLKDHRDNGTPMNVPIQINPNPPELQEKESVFQKLNPFKSLERPKDESDVEMQALIKQTKELGWRWPNFLQWWYGSYKYENDRGTWSDLLSREMMESRLTRYAEFFDYWIVSLFLQTYQYAKDQEFLQAKQDNLEYIKALAKIQSEHEKLNPTNQ